MYSCDSLTGKGWSQPGCDAGSFRSLLRAQSEVQSSDSLVEEHVRVGRQHLVQAGFSHRVVRHPQPLRAEGWGRRGGAAAVRDEMSWVHVAVVNQHSRELEKVLCRAGREDMRMIRGRAQMADGCRVKRKQHMLTRACRKAPVPLLFIQVSEVCWGHEHYLSKRYSLIIWFDGACLIIPCWHENKCFAKLCILASCSRTNSICCWLNKM